MIISRFLSFFFRFAEFVCAAVVLGITSFFLHQHHKYGINPLGRTIYTEVVAIISVLLSLVWLLPFTSTFLHYPFDLFMSVAWFAAFGVLVNWIHKIDCGGAFHWGGLYHNNTCSQWKADEAFAFLSAIFWLASALLSMYVYHKLERRAEVVPAGGRRRRRWI
jgi:uncharacterized membrane protein